MVFFSFSKRAEWFGVTGRASLLGTSRWKNVKQGMGRALKYLVSISDEQEGKGGGKGEGEGELSRVVRGG